MLKIKGMIRGAARGMTNLTPKKGAMTGRKKRMFIDALNKSPNVSLACKRAGISRETAYHWKKIDEEFCRSWDNAIEDGIDSLEIEAIRRAKKTSDVLLIFLLKSYRPATYRERYEHNIKNLPEMKAMSKGFAEMLKEYVPREHIESALRRFCQITGFEFPTGENGAANGAGSQS